MDRKNLGKTFLANVKGFIYDLKNINKFGLAWIFLFPVVLRLRGKIVPPPNENFFYKNLIFMHYEQLKSKKIQNRSQKNYHSRVPLSSPSGLLLTWSALHAIRRFRKVVKRVTDFLLQQDQKLFELLPKV